MKDKYNIEMEDISCFPLERSLDFLSWEDISYQDLLETVLKDLDDDQAHRFCRVVRGGSSFKLNNYFYRIKFN
ncbi:MAG: hypothetical protein F3745_00940 [Nitrospinae bacterium]|nr:hypothetical protein [Nitrospinota bacterium]